MKGGKIRVTLPDSMSDEEKIKSIENMKGIIKELGGARACIKAQLIAE